MSGAMNDSMNGPPPGCGPVRGHLLNQHTATGNNIVVERFHVGRIVVLTDVLTHLDGRDRIEGTVWNLSIILEANLDPVFQTERADLRVDKCLLLRRDRDSDNPGAVLPRCMQAERAPTTADIEKPQASRSIETDLAAHQVQLVCL